MAIPLHQQKGRASGAWVFRLMFAVALIGVSVWGISPCRKMFSGYVGPATLPQDSVFANLGAWAAWALFFGPLAVAGVVMVWSTVHKMGALDQLALWLWERSNQPDNVLANAGQSSGLARGSNTDDPRGLESLSADTVARLQRSAARAATILGALTGALSLGIGIFGLVSLLLYSGPSPNSPVYGSLATGRATISFALFSGMLVLLGLFVLQQTFRRENSGWLLPLRLFTYMIARRRAGERASDAGQHLPSSKQHPWV